MTKRITCKVINSVPLEKSFGSLDVESQLSIDSHAENISKSEFLTQLYRNLKIDAQESCTGKILNLSV